MSNGVKSLVICFVFVACFEVATPAQSPEIEEIKRKIELKRHELELKKIETELRNQEIELEKRNQELARIRAGGVRDAPSESRTAERAPDSTSITSEVDRSPGAAANNPGNGPGNTGVSTRQRDSLSGDTPLGANTQPLSAGAPSSASQTASDDCLIQTLDPPNATRYRTAICRIINRIAEQDMNTLTTRNTGNQFAEVLAAKLSPVPVIKSFFLDSEKQRTDKQVGSAPDSTGTTSLVVKGGTPALIGWAVEQGAATSSFSGNTVTVRFNPFNLSKALFLRQGLLDIRDVKPRDDAFDKFLRNVSLGVSFDTSRNTETPTFTARSEQVSAFSVRYEFINRRNPLSPRHKVARDKFFFEQTGNFDKIAQSILSIIDRRSGTFRNDSLNEWLSETNTKLAAIPSSARGAERRSQIASIIESQIEKIPFDELSKLADLTTAIESFADGSIGFKKGRDELLEEINDGQIATFEYTNNREPIAPDTSNFRFIWEKGIFRKTDFTFNTSLTMYNKKPTAPGVRRIRDFQFAAQTDTKLGNTFGTGDVLLSFAGRYQRQNGDAIDPLGVVTPGTQGDIAFGQVKLTIPISDWGIKLPFSLTFANRTELIQESNVRANFGFTFDLDPLFARFKPFLRP